MHAFIPPRRHENTFHILGRRLSWHPSNNVANEWEQDALFKMWLWRPSSQQKLKAQYWSPRDTWGRFWKYICLHVDHGKNIFDSWINIGVALNRTFNKFSNILKLGFPMAVRSNWGRRIFLQGGHYAIGNGAKTVTLPIHTVAKNQKRSIRTAR